MRNLGCILLALVLGCGGQPKHKFDTTGTVGELAGPDSTIVADSSKLAVTATMAAGDSSTYTISYVLSAAPRTLAQGGPDTVMIRFGRDSTSPTSSKLLVTKKLTTQRGSGTFTVARIRGEATRYYACFRVLSNVTLSEKCNRWATNFPLLTPVPTVDSIYVDSTLALSQVRGIYASKDRKQIQFCLFFKSTVDKKWRIARDQALIPGCGALYRQYPLAQRFEPVRAGALIGGHYLVHINGNDTTVTIQLIRDSVPAVPISLSYYIDHQMPAEVAARFRRH